MERSFSDLSLDYRLRKIMRQCRVSEPTANVVGELAGFKAARDLEATSEIVSTALRVWPR